MNIIIVHDDIITRKKLRQEIEHLGHRVIDEGVNGIQAYNGYVSFRPDIIFLNIDMPIYDGQQTVERILNYDSNACCIILSQPENNRHVFNLIEQGAKHFLNIPFERLTVSKLLEDIVKIKLEMEL